LQPKGKGTAFVRIELLKWIDSVAGVVVAACLPAAKVRSGVVPRRILVIRPGGIGDAVLLIPALVTLAHAFPGADLTVLAERRNAAAFALCPAVTRLLHYDTPCELISVLRGGYDLVIDTEQWHRLSAVVARLTRAPVSIGFASNDRQRLFSHRVPYSHDDYEAASFFNLLAPLGIQPFAATAAPFLSVPAAAQARAEELLGELSGSRFVALFPGASIAERRWGGQRFRGVAQALAGGGIPVVVVGGSVDVEDGEAIVSGVGGLNLAGRTTLAETAAVIARSGLLLSGDSGVLHIGVGLGVPTVSLFGPGIEAKWGPRGDGHVVVNRECDCSPCTRFGTTPPCPDGARCLSEISVAQVSAAVLELLGRQAS
jgi:heptosyltransferase II